MGFRIDLTGKKYGRWTVLGFSHNTERCMSVWDCRCECGTEAKIYSSNLQSGMSAGCNDCRIVSSTTHGLAGTAVYSFWTKYRALLCIRWATDVVVFNEECYLKRTGRSLASVDATKPIGPGNVEWIDGNRGAEIMRRKGWRSRAKVFVYLVSIGVGKVEALNRASSVSRQRISQLLKRIKVTDANIPEPTHQA